MWVVYAWCSVGLCLCIKYRIKIMSVVEKPNSDMSVGGEQGVESRGGEEYPSRVCVSVWGISPFAVTRRVEEVEPGVTYLQFGDMSGVGKSALFSVLTVMLEWFGEEDLAFDVESCGGVEVVIESGGSCEVENSSNHAVMVLDEAEGQTDLIELIFSVEKTIRASVDECSGS